MSFVCLLLSLQLRLSSVSVVFDFSDSLNDVTPLYSIKFAVDTKGIETSELLMNVFCVFSFFCLHNSDQVY